MLSIIVAISIAFAVPRPLTVGPGETALVFGLPAVNEAEAIQVVNKTQVALGDFAGVMPSQPRKAVVVHFFSRKRVPYRPLHPRAVARTRVRPHRGCPPTPGSGVPSRGLFPTWSGPWRPLENGGVGFLVIRDP